MSFTFRRAARKTTSCLVALAGASGSGKTFTAIVLALGLAYPDMTPAQIMALIEREGRSRVVVIDTEGGRALHYAPKDGEKPDFESNFPFEYAEIRPPFRPEVFKEAVVAADEAGFAVIIVDSLSHEWESEGGILEWADLLADGIPKPGVTDPDPWKKEQWIDQPVKSPGNWKEPKRSHKIMVGRFLQCRAHLIFCMRAEEKMQLVQEKFTGRDGKERTSVKVIPAADRPIRERWEPICEKRFMYEMTASFVLLPSEPGVGIPLKLQKQHEHCFPEGEQIGAKSGYCLAHWASANVPNSGTQSDPKPEASGAPAADPPADKGENYAVAERWANKHIDDLKACRNLDAYGAMTERHAGRRADLKAGYADLWAKVKAEDDATYARLTADE